MSTITETRKIKYMSGAVYGNLAYDLGTALPLPEEEAPVIERPKREERTYEKVSVRQKAKAAVRVAPFAVVSYFVVAVLLVFVLLSYVQLMELSNTGSHYTQQLNELTQEETRLQIAYESAFDLNEVEQYARTELGMIKADNNQIIYIDRSAPDSAVVLSGEKAQPSVFESINEFFSRLLEYFK